MNKKRPPSPLELNANPTLDEKQSALQTALALKEAWQVIRWVLLAWAVAVWLFLVTVPAINYIDDASSAMLHLPNVFIALGLVGAMFAAYSLKSDRHLLWFLAVLLLIAGWM